MWLTISWRSIPNVITGCVQRCLGSNGVAGQRSILKQVMELAPTNKILFVNNTFNETDG